MYTVKTTNTNASPYAAAQGWTAARWPCACSRSFKPLLLAWMIMSAAGCDAGAPADSSSRTAPTAKPISLTITSYNYTNRYIDQFFVNGRGGGNVFVSTETSGGGGGVCCLMYTPGLPPPKTVHVRWQASGCTFYGVDSGGERYSRAHSFFKELDVPVDPHVPANPTNFEVHFYPDNHVEAAITDGVSLPRLKLPANRSDRSNLPDCPGGKKPESNIHVETQR